MAEIGFAATFLSFVTALYTAITSVLGVRQKSASSAKSARSGALLGTVLATVAVICLLFLLLQRDFGVSYVYEHVSAELPLGYVVAALWAGQEGSLLFWFWLLALIVALVVLRPGSLRAKHAPYVLAVLSLVEAFLALTLISASDPFSRLAVVPSQGQGLNPLLRNFWMTVHPPVIFVSYALYTVPFALAVAGLLVGDMDGAWLRALRRWALMAWVFLGAGIIMGAWWAYMELGWGGYWGWDPVENGSLIPWLLGTALLHSLMSQERHGFSRVWNLWLSTLAFISCLLATFITRSGFIQSVHAFGRSLLGYFFLAAIIICLAAFVLFLRRRRPELEGGPQLSDMVSREAGLFYTNLLLVGAAIIVLGGTLFPSLVNIVQQRQAALDASFYERAVGPLMQVLVLLMGICPWLASHDKQGEKLGRRLLPAIVGALLTAVVLFVAGVHEMLFLVSASVCVFVIISIVMVFIVDALGRRRRLGEGLAIALARSVTRGRRRLGSHLVHLGIVLIALGITGSTLYQSEMQVSLKEGESASFGGYDLTYDRFVREVNPERERFETLVEVARGGRVLAMLAPAQEYYAGVEQWVTEVDIRSRLNEDVYVILAGFEQDRSASFRFLVNPLVIWIWIGGAMLLLGGCVAWAPSRRRQA